MAVQDLNSFYFKFKNLLFADKDATLTLKAEAGRVQVSLSADLGHVLPAEPPHLPHLHCRNGPARQRRRVIRAQERAGKEAEDASMNEAPTGKASEKGANQSNGIAEEIVEETVSSENTNSVKESVVEKEFHCELCDFKSNWQNGLSIHLTRKHSKLEQLDGNASDNEASDDKKYSSIKHYLKNGWLGSAYQTFIDALEVIDACDLQEDVKDVEKTKVLEARKCALGPHFQGLPPWNSSLQ